MIVNTDGKPKGKKETRCCIDLGSSYFRKLVVDVEPGADGLRFVNPVEERVYIGWGDEVGGITPVSKDTMDRAAEILVGLLGDMPGRTDVYLTVVATNVLRLALNADDIREYLEKISGVRINVLSERGEAFLGFRGATSHLKKGTPVMLLDLGGTSTEISWGPAPSASSFASLPIGTQTEYDAGAVPRLIAEIFEESGVPCGDSHLPGSKERHTIMLTGGTAVSLAIAWKQMTGEKCDYAASTEISIAEFERLHDWVFEFFISGTEERLDLPPERIKLFAFGTMLVTTFVRTFRAERITITARDLRWGVVLEDGITERGYLADEQESPDSR